MWNLKEDGWNDDQQGPDFDDVNFFFLVSHAMPLNI
jgi:hypothetical protein